MRNVSLLLPCLICVGCGRTQISAGQSKSSLVSKSQRRFFDGGCLVDLAPSVQEMHHIRALAGVAGRFNPLKVLAQILCTFNPAGAYNFPGPQAFAPLGASAISRAMPAKLLSEDVSWQGKRVLLTGASSGLGEALALELSSRGAKLVLAARRADRLTAIADECARASGGSAPSILAMDVTADSEELEGHASQAASLLGGAIDVLCYAAGVGQRTLATETSADGHGRLMATNFEGAVALARAVLPPMVDRGHGTLVVVSSVQGFFGQPGRSSYAASKAALVTYFDALRAEVAQHGVGVTVVVPGYIATDHSASAVGGDGTADENAKKGMPPKELAMQIADAVEKRRPQLIASQLDGRIAILLRAFWPGALFKIMQGKARKL